MVSEKLGSNQLFLWYKMIKFILIFFTLFSISKPLLAKAPPVILVDGKEFYEIGLNLDILEDPTGKLTIDDVNGPEWAGKFKRNKDQVANFGFSKSAFWARFKVKEKQRKEKSKWILSFNWYEQDEIKFIRKNKGAWKISTTGDFYSSSTREISSRSFSFDFIPKKNDFYFIRVKGSLSKIDLSIKSLKRHREDEVKENLIFGLFFGFLSCLIVYNLIIYLSTRSLSFIFYSFCYICFGLVLSIVFGFSQVYLAPNSMWMNNNGIGFFIGLACTFWYLFLISYLQLYKENSLIFKSSLFFTFTGFLVSISSVIFPISINLKIYIPLSGISILYSLVPSFHRYKAGFHLAKYLIFGILFTSFFIILINLSTLGLIPTNFISKYGLVIGFIMHATFSSYGVAERFNLFQRENIKLHKKFSEKLEDEVVRKTKEIKSLVENLGQGFMVINKEGIIQEGATQITNNFFNMDPVGKSLSQVLRLDEEKKEIFKRWIQNIYRGLLSFKDLKNLGPQSFELEGRYIELDYKPIYLENYKNKIDKIICVATDKTNEIELERQLELDKQNAEFVTTCLQNPVEFVDLMDDTHDLLKVYPTIKEMDQGELFRKFHTLKARYGQFRVKELTYYINEVETGISKRELNDLDSRVNKFEVKFQELIKKNHLIIQAANKFMVHHGNAVQVSDILDNKDSFSSLENLFIYLRENYLLSDIRGKFKRYASFVDELAAKQSKVIDVHFVGDEIKVDTNQYSTFINTSIHLFRNMVDHGIETEDERIEKTKPQRGSIKVDFKNNGETFIIQMSDDGEGIDPQKIKNKVLEKDLKPVSDLQKLKDSELIDMIFLPGFSTKEGITDISGRGVGMDAVREEVERLGGSISVTSKIDEGTTFLIKLPVLS